jgi:hypothetical protein
VYQFDPNEERGHHSSKNDVRPSVVGPKGTRWVDGAKGNKINFSGLRGSDQLFLELYDINGEEGLQNQLSGMEMPRFALAHVRRKGRLPKLVGLQSSNGYRGNRCSLMFGIGDEDFSGEIERAGRNRGSSGFLARGCLRGDLLGKASDSIVSHINRTCEIGLFKIGVRNVQHEPLKNKHDAANVVMIHNGFVKDVLKHGSNLGSAIRQIKEDIFQIFQGRYAFGNSCFHRFREGWEKRVKSGINWHVAHKLV